MKQRLPVPSGQRCRGGPCHAVSIGQAAVVVDIVDQGNTGLPAHGHQVRRCVHAVVIFQRQPVSDFPIKPVDHFYKPAAGSLFIAVGTTSVRVLETAAQIALPKSGISDPESSCPCQSVAAFTGPTDLYIYPGFQFRVVDALITNFHLPRSSLLLLVSAFASRELMMEAYEEAKRARYRFFSFGDAMLIQ